MKPGLQCCVLQPCSLGDLCMLQGPAAAVPDMPGLRKQESPVREFDKAELRERLTPTQYQVGHDTRCWST